MDARIYLYGLMVDCPYKNECNTCPLKDIRKLSLEERYEFITNLTENDMANLLFLHNTCSVKTKH